LSDGWFVLRGGRAIEFGLSDPNIHGWTAASIPTGKAHGCRPFPRCRATPLRDIVLTGLQHPRHRRQPHRRVPAERHGFQACQVIKGGKNPVRRPFTAPAGKADSNYTRDDWEGVCDGIGATRPGVAFGPKGSRFEHALVVSDNGMNDKGNPVLPTAPRNCSCSPRRVRMRVFRTRKA